MIKLVGVEKTLGGQRVLQGVDFDIPAGKLTTIIGRSGEGKSVLLKHMIGLLQPDRGQVWVGDKEISRMRGKALNEVRKRFAMLFQGAALFDSLTVFENVAFPLREKLRMKGAEVSRRADEKLEQVGLAGMGHKYPAELSGGMKKRAGLARALVMEPEIILFDELNAVTASPPRWLHRLCSTQKASIAILPDFGGKIRSSASTRSCWPPLTMSPA